MSQSAGASFIDKLLRFYCARLQSKSHRKVLEFTLLEYGVHCIDLVVFKARVQLHPIVNISILDIFD